MSSAGQSLEWRIRQKCPHESTQCGGRVVVDHVIGGKLFQLRVRPPPRVG
jgi:hypothetical protein